MVVNIIANAERCDPSPAVFKYNFTKSSISTNRLLYVSLKNDRPLYEARALVVDMCAGQMRRPKILESTIITILAQSLLPVKTIGQRNINTALYLL